jgi:hypothetical protein
LIFKFEIFTKTFLFHQNAVNTDDFLDQIGNKPSRRLSNASLESGNESFIDTHVVPNNLRLTTSFFNDINSDTESNAADNENADLDQLDEMPRDKVSIFKSYFCINDLS